jgi:hypothetical protein
VLELPYAIVPKLIVDEAGPIDPFGTAIGVLVTPEPTIELENTDPVDVVTEPGELGWTDGGGLDPFPLPLPCPCPCPRPLSADIGAYADDVSKAGEAAELALIGV